MWINDDQWASSFVNDHLTRCGMGAERRTLEQARPFLHAMYEVVTKYAVQRDVAEDASVLMAESETIPIDPVLHAQRFVEACHAIWDRRREAAPSPRFEALTRADAADRSRGCPDCGGHGMTARSGYLSGDRIHSFAFFCRCPHGRWMLGYYRALVPGDDTARRARDLQRYPELWLRNSVHPAWRDVPDRRDYSEAIRWLPPHDPTMVDMKEVELGVKALVSKHRGMLKRVDDAETQAAPPP